MKTSFLNSSCIEALEARLAPAGIIAVSVNSAGTLVLGTVAGQDGDEAVTVDRLSNGTYQLTPGAGVLLRIGGNNFNTAQIVTGVTAGLTANLGAGNDSLTLDGCYFTKGVTVNLGNGTNTFGMANSTVAGALMVTAGDGNDGVLFSGSNSAVAGAATFKLGAGQDVVNSTTDRLSFGAGLTFDGGAGNDSLILAATDGDDVRILGNLKFNGGGGDDVMTIGTTNTTFSASGSFMLSDTSGNETVTLAGTRFEAGAMVLQAGSGNNTLTTSVTDIILMRNFQWSSTTGNDFVDINGTSLRIGTNLAISMGTGGDRAEVEPFSLLSIGGTVNMTANATAGVTRNLTLVSNGELMVMGKVTINGGGGDGSLRVFGWTTNHLGGGVSLTSGAGVTNAGVLSNGSLICNGAISITHGGGDGYLEVFSSSAGDSAVNGAVTIKGGDTIDFTMAGMITGAVNVSTSATPVDAPAINFGPNGAGPIMLGSTVRVSMPNPVGQSGTINFSNAVFEGAVTVVGGAGVEALYINNSLFEKSVSANLGGGNDVFHLEQANSGGPSFYYGAVLLQGGAGQDVFLLGGNTVNTTAITFNNKVTVDGGAGNDTLTVGSQTTFNPLYPLKQIGMP